MPTRMCAGELSCADADGATAEASQKMSSISFLFIGFLPGENDGALPDRVTIPQCLPPRRAGI